MKRYVIMLAMLVAAFPVFATSIVNSAHDLSAGTSYYTPDPTTETATELCVFCHTPHNAVSTLAPLWNKTMTAQVFTLYSSTTLNGTVSQPSNASIACLTCHDGTLSVVAVSNPEAGEVGYTMAGATGNILGTGKLTGNANMGSDLTNDHPVTVTYRDDLDTGLNANTGATVGVLPLFGAGPNYSVECASCHNVHDPGTAAAGTLPFLRTGNTRSAMCLICHNK